MKRISALLLLLALMLAAYGEDRNPQEYLQGEWLLNNINGQKVTGDERPYLIFDLAAKRLYGCNGCNVINADVTTSGNRLKFTNILTTKEYCPDSQQQHLMNVLLAKVQSYSITKYGNEYYLELNNAQGQVMMILRKHNMDFLNGLWRVARIDGIDKLTTHIQLAIDLPLKHVHANAGCNVMNGDIFIDPAKDNSVTFLGLATTRTTCPDIEAETAFLVALEQVEYALIDDKDRVTMFNKRGHEVLVLVKE